MSTQKTTKWPDLQSFGAKLGFAVTEGGRRLVLEIVNAPLFKESLSPRYITALDNLGFNQNEFRPEAGLHLVAGGSALNLVDLQLLLPGFRAATHLREMTREEVQIEIKESSPASIKTTDPALVALGADEKFVSHVLEEDQGHNEGYSIRDSVLNIDEALKDSGLEPTWALKEETDEEDDSVYGVACATFKSTVNNEVARIEVYPDGKAIFFIGEERYRGDYYYATADNETQRAAIKEMASLFSKPSLIMKSFWEMSYSEFSVAMKRQDLTRESLGITEDIYRWSARHTNREDERLHRAILMMAIKDGHIIPAEVKNRYAMLDIDTTDWIAQQQEAAPAWADFTPNKFGYHSREVEGLNEKYFVAQWDKDTARIVEAERGNEEAQIRRMVDGRWMFEGSWATDDDITRYRETGNTFASPEEAVLHFHRYMAVIREPWQATFAEYVSFGGRQEGGYRMVGGSPSTDYSMEHREMVTQAVAEGKPVPAEVMAEYNLQPNGSVSTEEIEPATTSNPTNFAEWEGEVTRHIEELLEVPTSDAQGIVEAQPFIMQQAWGEGFDPVETAARIKKAAVVVNEPSPEPATQQDVLAILEKVKPFLSPSQLSIMGDATRGEEGQYFKDKFMEIAKVIDTMAKTYETNGLGDSAEVSLHYFKGDSHWYITEKDVDKDGEGQIQAYGYAVLNGDLQFAESGYINIAELTKYGVEMDLHWTPRPLAKVKDELYLSEDKSLAQELELEDRPEEVDPAIAALNATAGFAQFVMEYGKSHKEEGGDSPKESILHIDACAKQAGMKTVWTKAEDGTAVGTFTSPGTTGNQVGGARVFRNGKAIFLLNENRFAKSYATSDRAEQTLTVKALADVVLKTNVKKSKNELDPSNPEDYARIMKSEALQLGYQDFLDHFLVGRMIEIRNELRELGWDDDGSRPGHHGPLLKNGEKLVEEYKQVGAGANIVGLTLNGVQDDLTRTPAEWAKVIDDDAMGSRLKKAETPLTKNKEVEIDDLKNIGLATITSVGSENIYFEKDGEAYFCKVTNTSKYQLGEYDFSEKPAAAEEAKKTRKTKSKVIGKIDDVGEKIGGARKDIAGRRIVLADLEQMNEAEKQELVTKDKVFPPFDYRNMRDAGVDPAVALVLKLIRDRIPTSPAKVKRSVAKTFHVSTSSWQRGRYGYGYDGKKCTAEDYIKNVAILHDHLAGITSLDELRDRCQALRQLFMATSQEVDSLDFFETEKGLQFIASQQLRDVVGDKLYFTLCQADDYIARAIKVAERAGGWAAVIKERSSRQEGNKETDILPDRPHLQNIVREGGVPRAGDISADALLQATGCRGIEFGNWLPQDERQSVINHAHDAFQDLATVVGLPYEAISLEGTLAMAFGARGRGGKGAALAHFEPARKVINLTRLSGAGSLAHEWAHAIDDFLGSSLGQGGYLSEGAKFNRQSEEAGEIFLAVAGLMETMKKSEITFGECAQQADQKARKYLDWSGNWALSWGCGAFKDHETENEYHNEIKARIKQFKISLEGGFTQEKVEELSSLLDSFEDLFHKRGGKRIKQKDKNGFAGCANAATNQAEKAARFRLRNQDAVNDLGISKETDFLLGAKNLDRKRSKNYWSTDLEMFARAFECWVFDSLAERGIKSDYLVHGVEDFRFSDPKFRGNPYPTGEERAAINRQMSTLMEAVSSYMHSLQRKEQFTPAPSFG